MKIPQDITMKTRQKPPLGIEPKWCWERRRMINLAEAIKRYIDAGLPVPIEWINDYNGFVLKERDD